MMTRTNVPSTRMKGIPRNPRSWPSQMASRANGPCARPPILPLTAVAAASAIAFSGAATASELVDVEARLDALTPHLDLVLATNVLGHIVPALFDVGGRLFRCNVAVHHIGEVVVEDLHVLVVALDIKKRCRVLGVLQRRVKKLLPELGKDSLVTQILAPVRIPEALRMGDRPVADRRAGQPLDEPVRELGMVAIGIDLIRGSGRFRSAAHR